MRSNANAVLLPGPQATLVAKLEAAFGGDPGARIFLQAALRTARRSTLPPDPATLLAFVRAHLVDTIADELGSEAVAAFLEEVSGALQTVSGLEIRDADDGTAPPAHRRPSERGPPRLRVLLVHADRLARVGLARALVSGGCDVTVVETVVDLASILDELPDVAVVDLANEVEPVIEEMVRRNPDLRVLSLSEPGALAGLLDRCDVRMYEVARPGIHGREVLELARELARR
ncbi:MAG: hypothetical protein JNL79_33145 [Myxococcales bacterium]|nr:hypothetical protein [Myxococcales bacterium]